MAWWHGATDDSEVENLRGHTRVGQTGWIAWIDNGDARKVHCAFGTCRAEGGYPDGMVEIDTADGEHTLRVPHGRLDHSPEAALTNLSTDAKREGGNAIGAEQEAMARAIQRHQTSIDKISRTLLLDLVAIEQAKHGKYTKPEKKLGREPRKIEQTPPRITHEPKP